MEGTPLERIKTNGGTLVTDLLVTVSKPGTLEKIELPKKLLKSFGHRRRGWPKLRKLKKAEERF